MVQIIDRPTLYEQEASPEVHEFILPLKSKDLYTGDPNSSISYDYNAAVIHSQESTGDGTFNLDENTFRAIMPGNWETLRAGEALAAFDKAYSAHVMRMQKMPEAQITTIQSHEDSMSKSEGVSQINGINIPYEIMEGAQDATEWATAEQERRLEYVFNEAEYHLGRMFVAGGQTYEVTNIEYTGTDGNYETLKLGFKNIDTGKERLDVPLNTVEALVRSESPRETQDILEEPEEEPAKYEQSHVIDIEQLVQAELTHYDERFVSNTDPLERLEFEYFLRGHPSLVTAPANLPPQEATPLNWDADPTNPANNIPNKSIQQEVAPDIDYGRDRDEHTRHLHAAITQLALRHPLGEELVKEITLEDSRT